MQSTQPELRPESDPGDAGTRLIIYVLCSFMATIIIGWFSGVAITGRIWILAAATLLLWPVLCVILLSILLIFFSIVWVANPTPISKEGRSEFGTMKNEFVSFLFGYYESKRFLPLKAILLGVLLGFSLLFARYAIEITLANQ